MNKMHQSLAVWVSVIVLSWIHLVATDTDAAPCSHEDGLVRCQGLDKFPLASDIPEDTYELMLYECDINKIENIPDYGPSLVHLYIFNSNVRLIADHAFSNLTGLRVLHLTGNKIQTVTRETFGGLGKLEELDLASNLIQRLADRLLENLPSLIHLNLNANKHLSLSNYTLEGSQLQQLSIEHCGQNINVFPVLQQATALTNLDLDSNALGNLPLGILESLEELQHLYLANCNLSEIETGAFDGLVKLETLDLSLNRLAVLHEDVVHDIHGSLQKLLLRGNNLTTLSYKFSTYDHLGLEDNPWDCSCGLQWMKDITFVEGENVTCVTPSKVRGQNVHNVTSSLTCLCWPGGCQEKGRVALYIIIPILVVCAILIGYYVFKIVRKRKLQAERKSIRYSSVYKETVETSGDYELLHT